MVSSLQTQLQNAHQIKAVLKQVHTTFKLLDGRSVETLLVYLPCFEDSKTSHDALFKCIKESILQNFVFSYKEIQKKLGGTTHTAMEDLFKKAIKKISAHTAKGELGELILFTLLDVYIQAPKLLSKISMKTNPRMPVFGADAVHGQFFGEKFRVYLGESKLHKNFKSAATDATNSIFNAKNKFEDEFWLLDSYLDFPNLTPELEEKILKSLNPYSNCLSDKIHSPCFIGFTQPDIIFEDEKSFFQHYIKLSHNYIEDFFSKAEKQTLDINEITLLMLPFGCVDELVDEFITYMGITK
ncbi:DUF1837 domain-containing protein [Morganella morganii]|uniref:HamA C-terminal domain-containing protein n=1 Tax=Morganella morganii TaxID=582 RepID=UPI0007DB8B7B|nr:DUF1837 domain-containing protein [Morganella morganii]EME4037614.1 DUF1837 domain-containing protein [Morganella morganii]EME8469973.1 DUF1837 domain-containing protein [Morganella morganii]MBT0348534.1 DUF1837 domain-containing protein [Morganella morganii subsp. morganii]MBT0416139.1 DUF1837 domain-containing protein [Morganella morganii subsp. morganii]OAR98318.1 hypothetical protein AYO06_14790 [Morganella morganii]